MKKAVLVHNEAVEGHDDFLAIPIYTFTYAQDATEKLATIEHRKDINPKAMGFLTRLENLKYRFTEIGDLNDYKVVEIV